MRSMYDCVEPGVIVNDWMYVRNNLTYRETIDDNPLQWTTGTARRLVLAWFCQYRTTLSVTSSSGIKVHWTETLACRPIFSLCRTYSDTAASFTSRHYGWRYPAHRPG